MKEDKTLYILELQVFGNYFNITKDYFQSENIIEMVKMSQNSYCDILSLKFNCNDENDIEKSKNILQEIININKKYLMISASGDDSVDEVLLPNLLELINEECIICNVNEKTYKKIIPHIKNNKVVLKTPIDINLCKELNILTLNMGIRTEQIIIDTDIGALGYGLDYGYSTIEKIKLTKDEYLDFPIISYVCNESLKTKEAKAVVKNIKDTIERANYYEIASAMAVKAAGADLIVMYNPENIKLMKGLTR